MTFRSRAARWMGTVLLVGSPALSQPEGNAPARPEGLTFVETTADGWTVAYEYRGMVAGSVSLDQAPHLLFVGPTHTSSFREGDPALPIEVMRFGIPFDAHLEVSLDQTEFRTETNQHVAPVPTIEGPEGIAQVGAYRKNPDVYAVDRFFPDRQVYADEPFTLRNQRIATIRLAPIRYNPVSRTLQVLQRATLNIRLVRQGSGPAQEHLTPASPDPHFDPVYSMLLANYDQAREWRRSFSAATPQERDSTHAWFRTGVPYLKIGISRDGWYRVSRDDVRRALGADAGLISAALSNRGKPVPLVLKSDSLAEFFGYRKYGDSTYFDEYSDTNAYWLSWEPGARYRSTVWSGTPSDTISVVPVTRHFEENRAFYVGTQEQEIISNAPVPGRGWVWEYFYPNTTAVHDFLLDTVDTRVQASLKVRLQSTTLHYSTPDHRARFWVNDSLVGEASLDGRQTALFSVDFPGVLLRSGKNTLRITSIPTTSSPNQFALDWFEVVHSRPLVVTDGYLRFKVPGRSGGSGRLFVVTGLASDTAEVYDITTGRRIEGVTAVLAGTGRIAFADTASDQREYLVVTPGNSGRPDVVRRRVFADHRGNATGADYIVLTHARFEAAARELATHRERTNGVRTAVIDVEDLYDEFSFGLKHPGAMKEFLRDAVAHWPAPPPSHVLMYGDACEDPRGYDSSTAKVDYVPAYGRPTGDNWFACFDPVRPFLPSLIVGRLPVEEPMQARQVNAKIIGYDGYLPAAWSKRWLFITGGNSPGEQASFDAMTARLAKTYVAPAPIGGSVYSIAKATATVIDGDSRESIKDLIRDGLVFVNFLGHSGGRIWNVDVGNPSEFENTNGRLPVVISVSCNVGAFASAAQNCLAEDFLFADNRGAVALWGSSSLGYPGPGTSMVEYMLGRLSADTVRSIGALTTAARYHLWTLYGTGAVTVAHLNLTPLVGDPMTRMALPVKPDIAIGEEDFTLERQNVVVGDSAAVLKLKVRNFGLVPRDSVDVHVTDSWGGGPPEPVLQTVLPPVRNVDSVAAKWNPGTRPGKHTLIATVDGPGRIGEVVKSNNTLRLEPYVYVGNLLPVNPPDHAEVRAGSQNLVVALPSMYDAEGWKVSFELDTIGTFDSPWCVRSGPRYPGPVSAQWTTPALPEGALFFWRARADGGVALGTWASGCFRTVRATQPPPHARWRQSERSEFLRNDRRSLVATDSGVIVGAPPPVRLRTRSRGARSAAAGELFSSISVNDQTTLGYWWVLGYGFMIARVNPFTAAYELRGYNVVYEPAKADSMAAFIENTPNGYFLAVAVIIDGRSGTNERLFRALESIGASNIRQIGVGDSWTLISRKGQGMPGLPTERWSRDGTAEDSTEVPIRYPSGIMETSLIPMAAGWKTFGWERAVPGGSSMRLSLLGHRRTGGVDTVALSGGPIDSVDLRPLEAGALFRAYSGLSASVLMSTTDPLGGPVLRRWWIDSEAPADLAIGPGTVALASPATSGGANLTVLARIHNIGFRQSPPSLCEVATRDQHGVTSTLASVAIPEIPRDSSIEVTVSLPGTGLPPRATIRVAVTQVGNGVDLHAGNNTVDLLYRSENPLPGRIQILADGAEKLDGDYIASSPKMSIRVPRREGSIRRAIETHLDGASLGLQMIQYGTSTPVAPAEDVELSPTLPVGDHQFSVTVVDMYQSGPPDSSERRILLKVSDELRIVNLLNYPNPFSRETEFTFTLSGSRAPERAVLNVYSIAGRKIREIEPVEGEIRIGFNRIAWDGRDADGDEIANGVYLYKLELRDGEISVSELGKLAKLR